MYSKIYQITFNKNRIMGKALVFKGVKVDSPLQTVTFVKELITASDYVNEYSKLATSVTSEQKTNLVTFVKTLIDNNLWNKVRCCFPMLGGLDGYNKDLKDVFNQRTWNTPTVGTTWDATRNAPYLNLQGMASGTPLVIENMDKNNSSFLFSTKFKRTGNTAIIGLYYLNAPEQKYINDTLFTSNGGWGCPAWGTPLVDENLRGYDKDAQANNIYMVTQGGGTNSLFVCSNSVTLLSWKTGSTTSEDTTQAAFAFGNFYQANVEAPAPYTLNGCMNMFIAFNSALTEEELKVVSKAVWDFDEACGRHINFTD